MNGFYEILPKKIRNGKKTRAKEGKVMTTYPTYRLQKRPIRP